MQTLSGGRIGIAAQALGIIGSYELALNILKKEKHLVNQYVIIKNGDLN